MQGARHVETDLVQKMLRNQQYEQHMKKLGEISHKQGLLRISKQKNFGFKDFPVLLKTQQLKAQSSRFQKSEQRRRIDEQNQFLTSHIIDIQDGKNSQFRSIWTVSNDRNKLMVQDYIDQADTSIWCDGALGKRLHSPLRRKQQHKIEEENQQLMQRIEQTKQILLEKQQDQIQKYQKLRDHMTRIKGKGISSPSNNSILPGLAKSKSQQTKYMMRPIGDSGYRMGELLTKSDINISKISKIE